MSVDKHLFCFGLGYSALYFTRRLQELGFRISGTCRTREKAEDLKREGISAHIFRDDVGLADPSGILEDVTHMLISIAPEQEGDMVLAEYSKIIKKMPNLAWVGYLSTTGVYGDTDGAWVTEDSPLRPNNARLNRRVEAEKEWLKLWQKNKVPVHIFRLSGIYGPERNAINDVLNGTAKRIYKHGQFFSRIHVEDIAETLLQSMSNPTPGEIYNVCDDEPAPSHVIVSYACQLLGVEPPALIPFEEAKLTPMGKSFYMNNRRVSNRKLRQKLGVQLFYPTYREGLDALADSLKPDA